MKKVFFYLFCIYGSAVESRNKNFLPPYIKKGILPDITIISDFCKSYDCRAKKGLLTLKGLLFFFLNFNCIYRTLIYTRLVTTRSYKIKSLVRIQIPLNLCGEPIKGPLRLVDDGNVFFRWIFSQEGSIC